jgi:autotransporter-associated beta strand protein
MTLGGAIIKAADSNNVPHNITLSGTISGTSNLVKIGGGILDLTGANTYSGSTTISNGTLLVDGTSGNGAVTVMTNTTLGGIGTISGAVTVNNGGHTLPGGYLGNTAGATTTVSANLTYNTGAEADFNLSGSSGSGNGQIVVNNGGTLRGNNVAIGINLTDPNTNIDTTADYVLFNVNAGTIASGFPLTPKWIGPQPTNAANFTIVNSGSQIVLHYSPIAISSATATSPATRNSRVNISVTATAGVNTITSATVDVSAITGTSPGTTILPLVLSGTANTYTNSTIVVSSTALGSQTLTVSLTDSASDTGTIPIALTIVGAPEVWNGNASPDNTWGNGLNWAGGFSPLTGDLVTFAGANQLTPNMESSYSIGSLTFDGTAGKFNITNSANTLTLTGSLTNNSTNTETLSVPVALSGAPTFNAAAGNIAISNNVSDDGKGFVKTGTNILKLAAFNNTYTGPTIINGGILSLFGDSSSGSGPVTNNATLRLADTNALNGSSAVILNSGSTLQLRADTNSTFNAPGLALQNAPDTLTFDVSNLTAGVTGQTLSLANVLTFASSSDQTINVTGNSSYSLSLGSIILTATAHVPFPNLTINTLPTGASVTIGSVTYGNWGNDLNLNGGGNVTITGNLTSTSGGEVILFVNNGTTATLQGSSRNAQVGGDGDKYDVVNGTLILDSSSALTNNTTAAGLDQSLFILGAATNVFNGTGYSEEAGVLTATNNSCNAAVYLGDAAHATGGLAVAANVTNYISDGDIGFTNSGVFTVGGQNTGGINTYSNRIILGWTANRGKSVTLVAATGGEVDFIGGIFANGTDTTAGVTVGDSIHKGVVKFTAANTYAGPTMINAGTLALGTGNSIASSASLAIAAGATFDVSALGSYTISTNKTLTASGTASPATINGASGESISLSGQPIILNYDGSHPALIISGGGILSLGTNAFTVNTASPLAAGTYTIAQQSAGNIVDGGNYPAVVGTAIGVGNTGSVSVSGGNVILTVVSTAPPAPVSAFSSSATNIFVTQTVLFTNTSTGSFTNSAWSFGDGNTASLNGANVSNSVSDTYLTAGTFPVQLIVTGAGGSSTNTPSFFVTVKPKPVLGKPVLSGGNFIFNGTNGAAGAQYRILTTTNIALSLSNWTPVLTNTIGSDGSYGYTNSSPTNKASFFRLVSP